MTPTHRPRHRRSLRLRRQQLRPQPRTQPAPTQPARKRRSNQKRKRPTRLYKPFVSARPSEIVERLHSMRMQRVSHSIFSWHTVVDESHSSRGVSMSSADMRPSDETCNRHAGKPQRQITKKNPTIGDLKTFHAAVTKYTNRILYMRALPHYLRVSPFWSFLRVPALLDSFAPSGHALTVCSATVPRQCGRPWSVVVVASPTFGMTMYTDALPCAPFRR